MIKHLLMKNYLFLSFLGLLVAFSGCVNVGLQKASPDIKTYALAANSTAHVAYAGRPVSFRIKSFYAAPAAWDRYLTYRTSEMAYEQDYYNQLIVAPAMMIRDQLLLWMKGSPVASFVLPPDSSQDPDYVIDGKVLALYGDYRDETHPKAVISVECLLSHYRAETSKLVMQKIYSQEIPMKRISPLILTEAWSKGLCQILTDFENDLQEFLAKS